MYAGIVLLTLALTSCASVPIQYNLASFRRFPSYDPTGQKKATSEAYFHYIASQAWLKEGKLEGAIYEIKEALVQDPSSAFLKVSLADLYLRQGDLSSALTQARKAVAQDGKYLRGRVLLAQICTKTGDIAGALREYETALKIEPTNQELLLALSRLHIQMGHQAEAQRILGSAAAGEPGG